MRTTSQKLQALFMLLVPGASLASASCGGTIVTRATDDGGNAISDSGTRDPIFATLAENVCLTRDELGAGFPHDATLAAGVDYLGAYGFEALQGPGQLGWKMNTTAKVTAGEACKSAVDKDACRAALIDKPSDPKASLPGWSTCSGFCALDPVQVRMTKGDVVSILQTSPEEVFPHYLPIDKPSEAIARVAATRTYDTVGCLGNDVKREATGSFLVHARRSNCVPNASSGGALTTSDFVVRVEADGTVSVVTQEDSVKEGPCAVAGRRPEGLARPCAMAMGSERGTYLARMAHLEAASIVAFERMIEELRDRGAPLDLLRRAERAMRDEVRHSETMHALAAREGALPLAVVVTRSEGRDLFTMAKENLVEGCVRETFGALVAHRQAETAEDTSFRFVMRAIAHDETEHAALSWDLHAWFCSRLTGDERASLESAFHDAIETLATEVASVEPDAVRKAFGLPDAQEGLALAGSLVSALQAWLAA